MLISRTLNALGLFVSTIAALLLLIVPLSGSEISHDKATKTYSASTILSSKVIVPRWKVWLPKLGFLLLFFGFVLQFLAVWFGA